MQEVFVQLRKDFFAQLASAQTINALTALENDFFSRKSGKLTEFFKKVGNFTGEERKQFGEQMNALKQELLRALEQKKTDFVSGNIAETEWVDVTQPLFLRKEKGHLHPLTTARWAMEEVALHMGFLVEDGPELESDYYNFTALNIPPEHPARDMQDTLYIKDHPSWCMRTHVSNMQVRLLRKYGAPLRAAYPGKCFRNEATDARHEHTFYQYEFFVVDHEITLAHMIGVIKEILKGLYQKEIQVRLRPKYYPFVEPGVNGEISCILCNAKGCRVCKYTGWLEIFGAGLMHPRVLEAADLDPKKWSGFACGMGLDRLVMLKYGIEDARRMHSGDLRFLKQF